jgi:hypothetical protein
MKWKKIATAEWWKRKNYKLSKIQSSFVFNLHERKT